MRNQYWLCIAVLLSPLTAVAVELPSLVCREQRVVIVLPNTLKSNAYESSSLYRFTPKGLFLSDKDRAEYFYNEVNFVEPELRGSRFTSAHKTFFFDVTFNTATAVHSNSTEVRISQLLCAKN